jgi:hypothetical protein
MAHFIHHFIIINYFLSALKTSSFLFLGHHVYLFVPDFQFKTRTYFLLLFFIFIQTRKDLQSLLSLELILSFIEYHKSLLELGIQFKTI